MAVVMVAAATMIPMAAVVRTTILIPVLEGHIGIIVGRMAVVLIGLAIATTKHKATRTMLPFATVWAVVIVTVYPLPLIKTDN